MGGKTVNGRKGKLSLIIHNTLSLDGSVSGFPVDMELHYGIYSSFTPEAVLVGSQTAKKGIELFCPDVPDETEEDFAPPEYAVDDTRAVWVQADSRGVMEGLLHVYRRSEYGKDCIVLITKNTPASYKDYLMNRKYVHYEVGEDRIDFKKALGILREKHGFKTMLTDTGGTLGCLLLEQGLVDELSFIISPQLIGKAGQPFFRTLEEKGISLKLIKAEALKDSHVHLRYAVGTMEQ